MQAETIDMVIAQSIVWLFTAYLAAGLLFAMAFAWRGAGALDPAARHGSWGFRLLILPASAALWPLLATRWVLAARASKGNGDGSHA